MWTFLTHHAHVLLAIARLDDPTVVHIARVVSISERSVVTILGDLVDEGYVERERHGRRNQYTIRLDRPLRHPSDAGYTVGDLLAALTRHDA